MGENGSVDGLQRSCQWKITKLTKKDQGSNFLNSIEFSVGLY